MADKVPTIIESSLTNGGKRTLVDSDLATGAHVPAHYHTEFTETFTLQSGSMTVWTAGDGNLNEEDLKPIELEVGKPVPIPPHTLHKFLVNEAAQAQVSFVPGSIGFERTLLIMRGTQKDGSYTDFSELRGEKDAMLMSILGELANTMFVGEAKTRMDGFVAAKGEELEKFKKELIEKYASEEHLRKNAGL